MGYLKYKEYIGSVEYDEKKACLTGRVQGLRDELLSYSGFSVSELEHNFQRAIDSYIEKCYDKKEDPKRPYNGPLNVRLGPDIHGRAALLAEKLGITLNAFIKESVARNLERYER